MAAIKTDCCRGDFSDGMVRHSPDCGAAIIADLRAELAKATAERDDRAEANFRLGEQVLALRAEARRLRMEGAQRALVERDRPVGEREPGCLECPRCHESPMSVACDCCGYGEGLRAVECLNLRAELAQALAERDGAVAVGAQIERERDAALANSEARAGRLREVLEALRTEFEPDGSYSAAENAKRAALALEPGKEKP